MKTALLFCVGSLFVLGCGSSQAPATAKTTSAALTVEPSSPAAAPEKSAAEKWAEEKVAADMKNAKAAGEPKEAGDPLAMNDALEEASIPRIERTPAKELRKKGRGDLDAAIALVQTESSVDGAANKLAARLGKPTWTENGTRRIWVAPAGAQCHRLVLAPDGTVEVETASKNEWRMLAATAKQNPCTGEIKRGIGK